MKPPTLKTLVCAIYTRKSTEHNLDLAFNSLDAQREACGAYVRARPTKAGGSRPSAMTTADCRAHRWNVLLCNSSSLR